MVSTLRISTHVQPLQLSVFRGIPQGVLSLHVQAPLVNGSLLFHGLMSALWLIPCHPPEEQYFIPDVSLSIGGLIVPFTWTFAGFSPI